MICSWSLCCKSHPAQIYPGFDCFIPCDICLWFQRPNRLSRNNEENHWFVAQWCFLFSNFKLNATVWDDILDHFPYMLYGNSDFIFQCILLTVKNTKTVFIVLSLWMTIWLVSNPAWPKPTDLLWGPNKMTERHQAHQCRLAYAAIKKNLWPQYLGCAAGTPPPCKAEFIQLFMRKFSLLSVECITCTVHG